LSKLHYIFLDEGGLLDWVKFFKESLNEIVQRWNQTDM